MSDLPHLLTVALSASPPITYGLIMVLAVLEGPVLFVVCGFLLSLGALSLLPLFISLSIGDLIGDVIWYWVGYSVVEKALRKHGSYMGLTTERLTKLERLFNKHSSWLLFSSKATLGFGTSAATLPMLMTAGVMKYPFKKYLLLNICGEVVLLAIMLSIGYGFGSSYHTISKDFKIAFLIGLAVVIVAGAVLIRVVGKKKGEAL